MTALDLDTVLHRCDACVPPAWGHTWELGSAAFWPHLARSAAPASHRLADSLPAELVACILGGFGVLGDVGIAAFAALRRDGVLTTAQSADERADTISTLLRQPMPIPGRPRPVRYRFWRQRGRRIADALALLEQWRGNPDLDPALAPDAREMRDRLLAIPGVGPKTASWTVRNHLDSDDVAIIDIHIARAGVTAGLFCRYWRLPNDYARYEQAFLSWSQAAEVRASTLDAVIWRTLADLGPHGDTLLGAPRTVITGRQRPAHA